ncbi:MAG: DUF3800 domain-containing protein [Isosphaeraceae bacterium]
MPFRIYADESGTHDQQWLIIGMLFVPNHGPLHADLCKAKDDQGYFNTSPKRSARYKEVHLAEFRSKRDVEIGKRWVDLFITHDCYYRSVVFEWAKWDGKHFGDPFEPDALKKRRAYKKWAEMLLHLELKGKGGRPPILNASFYLDRLRIMYGYDVVDHLRSRFTRNYVGDSPHIGDFQHTDSWKDANQCLQLCDLLTGCLYQELSPSKKPEKLEVRDYLAESLKPLGVKRLAPGFWKQFDPSTLNQHLNKFSAWFWRPNKDRKRARGKRGR